MDEVRTNVVLPADLLSEIDREAGPRQRSRFLAEAAREKLARLRFERAAESAFGSWTDADHPELRNEADVQAYLRHLRETADRRLQSRVGDG